MTIDWTFINALVQWLIIPMIALIWRANEKLTQHDRDILKVLTIIGEQDKARMVLRQHEAEAIARLETAIGKQASAIDKLNDRLDKILAHEK